MCIYETCSLLCICVILILVLISYLENKSPSQCRKNIAKCTRIYKTPKQCHYTSDYLKTLDRRLASKKQLNPENDVYKEHIMGETLDNLQQKMDDHLMLDEIVQSKNLETRTAQVNRSFSECDGPELEGMTPPIDQFERSAMHRQLNKRQEIYGEQAYVSNSDSLSELNL